MNKGTRTFIRFLVLPGQAGGSKEIDERREEVRRKGEEKIRTSDEEM